MFAVAMDCGLEEVLDGLTRGDRCDAIIFTRCRDWDGVIEDNVQGSCIFRG